MDISPAGFTLDDPPPETDEEALKRLAALPLLEYERCRAAEAERLGIGRLSVLDQLVAQHRDEDGVATGRGVVLHDPEPWDHPVSGGDLLTGLVQAIKRHLVTSNSSSTAIAAWIAHTYVYSRFDHTPRLGITSPMPRCGKSTLLDLLRITCRRSLKADSVSASGVFRTVEALAPLTLLVDEADSFLRDAEELRGVLNSGFERSGQVIRVVERKEEHVPVAFATFAPVALAAIGSLPATLEDRCIPIRLERKAPNDVVQKLREADNRAQLSNLARKCVRWASDHARSLSQNPSVPDAFGDREADISIPLLSIADQAGGEWPDKVRTALLDLFGRRAADDGSAPVQTLLLKDLRQLFGTAEAMFSAVLCKELAEMEHRPWPEWGRARKPMTQNQLARALQPFKIHPGTVRIGNDTSKGYYRKSFEDVWSRYLPNQTVTPLQARTSAVLGGIQPVTSQIRVTEQKCGKPAKVLDCGDVSVRETPYRDEGVYEGDAEVII